MATELWEAEIPPSIVMAMDLDNTSVVRGFESNGIFVTFGKRGKKPQAWISVTDQMAARSLISELEYRASDSWDSPFGVRMAMVKVAARLRREWAELLGRVPMFSLLNDGLRFCALPERNRQEVTGFSEPAQDHIRNALEMLTNCGDDKYLIGNERRVVYDAGAIEAVKARLEKALGRP